ILLRPCDLPGGQRKQLIHTQDLSTDFVARAYRSIGAGRYTQHHQNNQDQLHNYPYFARNGRICSSCACSFSSSVISTLNATTEFSTASRPLRMPCRRPTTMQPSVSVAQLPGWIMMYDRFGTARTSQPTE